jgi:hypothetical protein
MGPECAGGKTIWDADFESQPANISTGLTYVFFFFIGAPPQ